MLSKIFKKNVLSSLLCLILITVSTVPSMAETLKSSKLTEEQKDLYYVEYEKIINSVNESEGKNLELERKEDFSDDDWVHPIEFRKRVKEQDKEIRRLKEENEFLEEASAFFAASRRKSAKNRD